LQIATAAKSRYRRFGPIAASHLRGVTGLKSKAFPADQPPLSSTWAGHRQLSTDPAYLCLPGGGSGFRDRHTACECAHRVFREGRHQRTDRGAEHVPTRAVSHGLV